eukprot:CAMPEP_0117657632 /NCGR_PEP_ID=MMETSP0804-20121206/5435_1 /TAXON_ID=1074897 /ORGANISM="Tetraselmis astigmatica, Strain CCMP880" /LENGTH=438 /DNA_ID=CAMNT_0005464101 /DNA_START=261 /DNA_END=1578 /DNA_ORIENTATION=-
MAPDFRGSRWQAAWVSRGGGIETPVSADCDRWPRVKKPGQALWADGKLPLLKEDAKVRPDPFAEAVGADIQIVGKLDYSQVFFRVLRGLLVSVWVRKYWLVPWRAVAFFGGSAAALQFVEGLRSMGILSSSLQILTGLGYVEQYLTVPLGFLLVFRANQAYNRWWETRRTIGSIMVATHELGVLASATLTRKDLEVTLNLLKGFTVAFEDLFDPTVESNRARREHLREVLSEDVYKLIQPCIVEEGLTSVHSPATLAQRQTLDSILQVLQFQMYNAVQGDMQGAVTMGAASNISRILQGVEHCAEVYTTPIALSYTIHLRVLLLLFLLAVPCHLMDIGVNPLVVVPDTMAMAYAFLGIDYMSTALSSPFGEDEEDLPVGLYTARTRQQLEQISVIRRQWTDWNKEMDSSQAELLASISDISLGNGVERRSGSPGQRHE